MIRVAGITNESIVDGEGLRLVVFAQGCAHACPGCHNPESHSFTGGDFVDEEEIISRIKRNPLLDGITYSGGDPFFQPEAFQKLSRLLRKEVIALDGNFSIMAYTGFTFEELLSKEDVYLPLLREIDILVDGRFIQEERSLSLLFRGSKNQRILDMRRSLAEQRPVLHEVEA